MKRKPINVSSDSWLDLKELQLEHQRKGHNTRLCDLTDRLLKRAIAAEKRRLAS
jgi:hypothetical protein